LSTIRLCASSLRMIISMPELPLAARLFRSCDL